MPKIQIFGGGIAGLTAALLLEKQQQDYQLFERQSHWGGKLQTTLRDGFALDHGFQVFSRPIPRYRCFIVKDTWTTVGHSVQGHGYW